MGPLLLGANDGVKVLTTQMYLRTSESPSDFAAAAAAGSPLVILGLLIMFGQRILLTDQSRFVTHGGRASRPTKGGRSVTRTVIILVYVVLMLPFVLFDLWSNGSCPLVAAMALLRTLVTSVGVVAAMMIGGRNVLDNLSASRRSDTQASHRSGVAAVLPSPRRG